MGRGGGGGHTHDITLFGKQMYYVFYGEIVRMNRLVVNRSLAVCQVKN